MRSGGGGGVAKRVDGREKSHPANRRLVLRSPPPAAVSSAVQATSRCYQAMQHDAGAGPAFGQIFRLNSLLLLLKSPSVSAKSQKTKRLSYRIFPRLQRHGSPLSSSPSPRAPAARLRGMGEVFSAPQGECNARHLRVPRLSRHVAREAHAER